MSAESRRPHKDNMITAIHDKETAGRFVAAQVFLKGHLVHTREILNGLDFLFLGPQKELHDALKLMVDVEAKNNRILHINYVQVDQYFLLRVIGLETEQQMIAGYF